MVIVAVETAGKNQKYIRGFSRFELIMEDMRDPFLAIIKDFFEVEKDIFDREGYPEKFKPVTPEYQKWKDTYFPGQTIMRLRDNLHDALTGGQPEDSTKARLDVKVGKQSLYIGVISPYFNAQERQGRKAIQISEETRRRWDQIIQRWAYRKYKKEVLGE